MSCVAVDPLKSDCSDSHPCPPIAKLLIHLELALPVLLFSFENEENRRTYHMGLFSVVLFKTMHVTTGTHQNPQ